MPNKILRKSSTDTLRDSSSENASTQGTIRYSDPIVDQAPKADLSLVKSEIPASPADSLSRSNGSCFDHVKQLFKTSSHRGPLFWCAICACILILLAIIIALIIYFGFWVGAPNVKIVQVIPPDPSSDAQGISLDLGQPGQRAPSFKMKLLIQVQIDNPNKMDLSFEPVSIGAFNQLLPSLEIGTSTLESLFLPKQDTVFVTVPVLITYDFGNPEDTNHVLPNDLVNSCTVPPGQTTPSKQITLNLEIYATLRVTNEIRVKIPTIKTPSAFDCPFKTSQTISVGGMNVTLSKIDWNKIAQGQIGFQ